MINFFISVTSHALYPVSPVTNCHTFSEPLPPSRVTYFMDGPLCRLSVIHILSAACERGFSAMNAQKSPTRNRLLMKNLDGILFVSVNDMPLNCWDPNPYKIMTWLKSGIHSGADKLVGKAKKKTVA